MKLSDVSGVWASFCFWRDRKKPALQLAVWIVGGIIIVFLAIKEFCERRMKK